MIEEEDKIPIDTNDINPVDYFNENHAQYILTLFCSKPLGNFTSHDSFSYSENRVDRKSKMIVLKDNYFMALKENALGMPIGELYSPFRMLCEFEFKNNWKRAIWFIVNEIMNNPVPYIRVATKFYKTIKKVDRNKITRTELKLWDKVTIVDDYGRAYINKIPDYDDFTIEPDNKNYNQIRGNNYNLYSPFEHVAAKEYAEEDIKWTTKLLKHIFDDQYELGLTYLKVLYDLPTQKLPILVLTSEERSTGKTTFLDYLELLFGANSVVINPQDISNSFNGAYASSNIIMIEESRFESVQATEKLKNLATQKKIMVNNKFIQQYSIPFHGKLIITSNDEKRFSRVDDSEIRYWVRKVPTLKGKANHQILTDLRNEIPAFLAKLNSMPPIDITKSRMVFEENVLKTEALATVKLESRSGLHKELELLFDSHCAENRGVHTFKFIAKDLKEAWFKNNSRIEINYINSVLLNQMKLERGDMQRYSPLESDMLAVKKRSGKPYKMKNPYYDSSQKKEPSKPSHEDKIKAMRWCFKNEIIIYFEPINWREGRLVIEEKGIPRVSEEIYKQVKLRPKEPRYWEVVYDLYYKLFKEKKPMDKDNKESYDEKGNASHYNTNRVNDMVMLERMYGTEALMHFCEITAMKYRIRIGKKKTQSPEQEIVKAEWYEKAAAFYQEKIALGKLVKGPESSNKYPWE